MYTVIGSCGDKILKYLLFNPTFYRFSTGLHHQMCILHSARVLRVNFQQWITLPEINKPFILETLQKIVLVCIISLVTDQCWRVTSVTPHRGGRILALRARDLNIELVLVWWSHENDLNQLIWSHAGAEAPAIEQIDHRASYYIKVLYMPPNLRKVFKDFWP